MELRVLTERRLKEICRHVDELSSHWSKLKVGQFMVVRWSELWYWIPHYLRARDPIHVGLSQKSQKE